MTISRPYKTRSIFCCVTGNKYSTKISATYTTTTTTTTTNYYYYYYYRPASKGEILTHSEKFEISLTLPKTE